MLRIEPTALFVSDKNSTIEPPIQASFLLSCLGKCSSLALASQVAGIIGVWMGGSMPFFFFLSSLNMCRCTCALTRLYQQSEGGKYPYADFTEGAEGQSPEGTGAG